MQRIWEPCVCVCVFGHVCLRVYTPVLLGDSADDRAAR